MKVTTRLFAAVLAISGWVTAASRSFKVNTTDYDNNLRQAPATPPPDIGRMGVTFQTWTATIMSWGIALAVMLSFGKSANNAGNSLYATIFGKAIGKPPGDRFSHRRTGDYLMRFFLRDNVDIGATAHKAGRLDQLRLGAIALFASLIGATHKLLSSIIVLAVGDGVHQRNMTGGAGTQLIAAR